jgi:large subunit ribosomal protein L17
MFRNMVTSLLKHDRIKTTEVKAKELRRWADHIVTLAKKGDLHARRMAMAIVREKDVVHKLFEEATDRFGAINGGYTRIIKIGRRAGDAAAMTIIEMVSSDGVKPGKKKKSLAKTDEKAAAEITAKSETSASQESKKSAAATGSAEGEALETAPVDSESQPIAPDGDSAEDLKANADSVETDK